MLGTARIALQLDVGFGDAVPPGPERVRYPTNLVDLQTRELFAYPRATVIAKILEVIVKLESANSRMKDYLDLFALSQESTAEHDQMLAAIAETFARLRTSILRQLPIGSSAELAADRR